MGSTIRTNMKIEIDIDIESIIVAALKQTEGRIPSEHAPIKVSVPAYPGNVDRSRPVPGTSDSATPPGTRSRPAPPGLEWEYAPKSGKRRTPAETALHGKELQLNRNLTPEEKGETRAIAEMDEELEEQVREETKQKVHIQKLVDESTEAASKELAEEEEQEGRAFVNGEEITAPTTEEEPEAVTPIAPPLPVTVPPHTLFK